MSTTKDFVLKNGLTVGTTRVIDNAGKIDFSVLKNKPTTLAGFGITDGGGSAQTVNPSFSGTLGLAGGIQLTNGSGSTYLYNDANVYNFVIRTGAAAAFKYSVFDASGNLTIPGTSYVNQLVINATSNLKLVFQESGTTRGYIGADVNACLYAINATNSAYRFTVSNLGDVTANSFSGIHYGNGASLTGIPQLGTASLWSSAQSFLSNLNTAYGGPAGNLWAYSNNGGGACMSFHRGGAYAINMGLDNDNVFRIGGWSAPANLMQLDMAGNVYFLANVAAFSDRRLKHDIEPITDALARLLRLNGVTFKLNESNQASRGLIAQDVQVEYPELVRTPDEKTGMLTVAYANFAGDFVEALRIVDARQNEQDARLARLEAALLALQSIQ